MNTATTLQKTSPEQRRKALLAQIHIVRKQLTDAGVMDEDGYRAALRDATTSKFQTTGKESLKLMSEYDLKDSLRHLKKLAGLHGLAASKPANTAATPLQGKVQSLWQELHTAGKVRNASDAALNAYVRRIAKVDALRWTNDAQATVLIESLKKWLARP